MQDFKAHSFNETKSFPLELKHKSKVELGLEMPNLEDGGDTAKKAS
jgi:hypothetical protein